MTRFLFCFVAYIAGLIGCFSSVLANDSLVADTLAPWSYRGRTSLSSSQVSLTNWSAGGQPSLSINARFFLQANYERDRLAWENDLDLYYGIINQEYADKGDRQTRKSEDKMELNSKLGYQSANRERLYYTLLLSGKTQFDKGYDYPNDSVAISHFLAPAYINLSFGMDYKPFKALSVYVSPVAGKLTLVNNDEMAARGAFGVQPRHRERVELGGLTRLVYRNNLSDVFALDTKVDLYSNYLHKPENIDVNWEFLLTMQITQYLSASLNLHFIYDDDIMIVDKDNRSGPRPQFKQVLAVGFGYQF